MAQILSMQSHVVYGHAGNSAAVFPMQRLGHQVLSLNLLQYSNHTGYGAWGGSALTVSALQDLFDGLRKMKLLDKIDGIITGYIGSATQASVIAQFIQAIKTANPSAIYCCDPVIGDDHTGTYARPEVENAIKQYLLANADIITPNRYELALLSGLAITDIDSAKVACTVMANKYQQQVLATSIATESNKTGLLFCDQQQALHIETMKYKLNYTVRGTGDVTAATFLSHRLAGKNTLAALEQTTNTIHQIAKYSQQHNLTELGIIQCQDAIAQPDMTYRASNLAI